MIFGLDQATQTTFLFLFTLLVFFIVPLTYLGMKESRIQKLQKKSLLADWRIWIVCLVYTVIFGFRYNYLNDWEQYATYYEFIQNGGDNDGWREPGFYLFVKVLSQLGFSYYAMFVIECFVWIYSICYLFKENRNYLVFVLPFAFIGSTDLALNVSRQFFAMSFLLIAFRDYWDGKILRALLLGLIAPLIHYTAAIWLIVFVFLKRVEYVKPTWMVLMFLVVTVASSVFYNVLSTFAEAVSGYLSLLLDSRVYDSDVIDELQSEVVGANLRQMLTLGLTRGAYIYMYYHFRNKNLLSNPILNNITLIGMIGIIVSVLMGYNLVFSRIAAYIKIFYEMGWGVFAYNAFVRGKNQTAKVILMVVIIYLFGSFFIRIGEGHRSQIKDVNPYIIYQIQ